MSNFALHKKPVISSLTALREFSLQCKFEKNGSEPRRKTQLLSIVRCTKQFSFVRARGVVAAATLVVVALPFRK